MRINYISDARLPSRAANAVHIVKMCAAFSELGHDVVLAHRANGPLPDLSREYGVATAFRCVAMATPQIPLVGGMLFAVGCRRALADLGRPDLIYGRHVYAIASFCRSGVPCALELHQVPAKRLRRVVAWISRQRSCTAIVVISEALRQDLVHSLPDLCANKVIVAHDAADPMYPDEKGSDVPALSRRQGAVQVGYVGHLYPGKGMEMIAQLPQLLPEMDFHVVGGAEADIEAWRRSCRHDNLKFHGFVAHRQLPQFYRQFDIVLLPLQKRVQGADGADIARWTSPLKLFEYMAAGKAIVASNLPVLAEVLVDRRNGMLVQSDDPRGWVSALRELASDELLRLALGRAAEPELEEMYTWKRRASAIVERCVSGRALHDLQPNPAR